MTLPDDDAAKSSTAPADSLPEFAVDADDLTHIDGLPDETLACPEQKEPDQSSSSSENSISDEDEISEVAEEPPPPVLYKVHYLGHANDVVFDKESREPTVVHNALDTLGSPVIEVIKEFGILRAQDAYKAKETGEEPRTGTMSLGTKLNIKSAAILNALYSVIEYYPGLNLSEGSAILNDPCAVLIHHENELKAYRNRKNPDFISSQEEKLCQRDRKAYEHLGILLDLLQHRSGTAVEIERQRYARGVATFEMLWLLLKPGTDVYRDASSNGNYSAYVVRSVAYNSIGSNATALSIQLWFLDFDGIFVGRRSLTATQFLYDGEKNITELIVFPCEYWKDEPNEQGIIRPLKQKLESNGGTFFKLCQRQCMDYDGLTVSWPQRHVRMLNIRR